ncbi:hypothetical protein ACWDBD_11600 [Streptomyces sp. NPDC001118]
MVKTGRHLWHAHPHVRTGSSLSFGERAADRLKAAFGTWSLLGLIIGGITAWMLWVHDPGELRLNLALSFLASVQGVILQIAANRGDRIAAELAMHTFENGKKLLEINEAQSKLLGEIHNLQQQLADLRMP